MIYLLSKSVEFNLHYMLGAGQIFTTLDYADSVSVAEVHSEQFITTPTSWSYQFPEDGHYSCHFYVHNPNTDYDVYYEMLLNGVFLGRVSCADHDTHHTVFNVKVKSGSTLAYAGSSIRYRYGNSPKFYPATETTTGQVLFIVYRITSPFLT